jgi:hypothetical protein
MAPSQYCIVAILNDCYRPGRRATQSFSPEGKLCKIDASAGDPTCAASDLPDGQFRAAIGPRRPAALEKYCRRGDEIRVQVQRQVNFKSPAQKYHFRFS